MGRRNIQIATLAERWSRYVVLLKLAGKGSETVVTALIKHAGID